VGVGQVKAKRQSEALPAPAEIASRARSLHLRDMETKSAFRHLKSNLYPG